MIKDQISFEDFSKIDLRIGKVIHAEEVAGSTNLIRLRVDFGEDYHTSIVISGIRKWYEPAHLVGKSYIFVTNLAPKKMMNEESNGMILCADNGMQAILLPEIVDLLPGTVVR